MSVLAIDTATHACSVALLIDSQVIVRHEVLERAHTRLLMPMIDSVLKEANLSLSQIELLAYGCGPGSFTGVRIASAVIQGLSVGLKKPIVPISSLRALAQGVYRRYSESNVLAVFDARMQELYCGYYAIDEYGIMQLQGEEKLVPSGCLILSDKYAAGKDMPEGNWFLAQGYPEARDIATLAQKEYQMGHFITASEALPVYLRNTLFK